MSFMILFIKLVMKGVMYRFYRLTGYLPSIEVLSLELTRRCIAKCIMCNIWKTPADIPECSSSEWMEILSSPVFENLKELDITGGEPFLRTDLTDLLEGICDLKTTRFRGLRSVAITTNGFLTDKILAVINEIIPFLEERGLDLILVFAMDGIGATHDQVRNVRNGWQKLDASIQGIKHIREAHRNLVPGLKTTILPINIDELENIMEYAEQNDLFTIISPCIITGNRYDNMDRAKDLRFHKDDIEKMIQFYQRPRFQWSYHRDVLLHYLKNNVSVKPCSAGLNYYFIRSTGEVFPCPLIKKGLGNIKDTPIKTLIMSRAAKDFRRRIGRYEECHSCTEPGLERYALPFEGFHYLSLLLKMGRQDFLNLHQHMGLDKYV